MGGLFGSFLSKPSSGSTGHSLPSHSSGKSDTHDLRHHGSAANDSHHDLRHHGTHAANDDHSNQYGSRHGEINRKELVHGIKHDVHHAFHGTERKAIGALLSEQLDDSASNRRHVLDQHEADAIVNDVHHIYGSAHASKLREILNKRLQ